MRMFVVSVIGVAGLVCLFVYCAPLRDFARDVVLGQGTTAPPTTTAAQPAPTGSAAIQGEAVPGGGT